MIFKHKPLQIHKILPGHRRIIVLEHQHQCMNTGHRFHFCPVNGIGNIPIHRLQLTSTNQFSIRFIQTDFNSTGSILSLCFANERIHLHSCKIEIFPVSTISIPYSRQIFYRIAMCRTPNNYRGMPRQKTSPRRIHTQ